MSAKEYEDYTYIQLLTAENGCQAGCRTGLLMYAQEVYGQSNVHEDQEGFYVLEGSGKALVGDDEVTLRPGICFIVPPGSRHSIKKDNGCDYIKLFFFHAAV